MATTTNETRSSESPERRFPQRSRGSGSGLLVGLLVLGGLGAGVWLLASIGMAEPSEILEIETEPVTRGTLMVTVTEDGEIESAKPIELKCKVTGGAEIQEIVPDGTKIVEKGDPDKKADEVEVGDVLVKLDRSKIDDALDTQQISVEKARTAVIQAEKDLAVAKISVLEYENATFIQLLQDNDAEITIAEENMRGAQNQLEFSKKMYRKGFVTKLQLEADEFAVKRTELELQSSQTKREGLVKYTKPKQQEDLRSQVKTAAAKNRSEKNSLKLEERKLSRLKEQVANCEIRAPKVGMVVYANIRSRYGRTEQQIEEGAGVREGQTIIKLPDFTRMQVKVLVHESKVRQVAPGDRATMKIKGRSEELTGQVVSIANQAEQSSWFQASVKKYKTVVRIDGLPTDLMPNMSAEVVINVEQRDDILMLPVLAVVEMQQKFYCWVVPNPGDKPVQTELQVAKSAKGDDRMLTDNKFVGIESGVDEGQIVVQNPRDVIAAVRDSKKNKKQADREKVQKKGESNGSQKGYGKGAGGAVAGGGRPGGPGAAGARKGGGGGGQAQTGLGSFARFDADMDGKISKQEASSGYMASFFDRIDADSDGFVTAAEAEEFRKQFAAQGGGRGGGRGTGGGDERRKGAGGPGGGRGPGGDGGSGGGGGLTAERMLQFMDKDKDGKIGKDEARGRISDGFETGDTNSDGFLDKAELEKLLSAGRKRSGGGGGQ